MQISGNGPLPCIPDFVQDGCLIFTYMDAIFQMTWRFSQMAERRGSELLCDRNPKQRMKQVHCAQNTHTHTHTQPFYSPLDFVWDYPSEPAPER